MQWGFCGRDVKEESDTESSAEGKSRSRTNDLILLRLDVCAQIADVWIRPRLWRDPRAAGVDGDGAV